MPQTNDIPESEAHIYAQLIEIRAHLSSLKKDRTQYLTSKEVLTQYEKTLNVVKGLDTLRSPNPRETGNKVDQILDDIFQILSLFFITVGLIKKAPATYASLTTVQRLLEHLNESRVYTQNDLNPIKDRLVEIEGIVNDSEESPYETLILKTKLNICLKEYAQVESKIEKIDPELYSIFENLVWIRRELLSLVSRPDKVDKERLADLTKNLHDLETKRDSTGKFQSETTGEPKEHGQTVLNGLLDDCNTLITDITVSDFRLDESLNPIYDDLITLKTQLEDLLVTRRWTLRETDLYTFQKKLQEIDDLRVDGKFPTKNSSESLKGQTVLLYLLRRCYAIIYKLLESSEPVSEALQPLHNQLSTVRRCLLEVKRMGGVNSSRELYPYQMKLASLDNLRQDGKFIVDGQIPEGQGTLNALLAECYDICQELKVEAEENRKNDTNKGEDDEDDDDTVQNLYDNGDDEDDNIEDAAEDEEYEEADYPASYAPSIVES